MGNMFVTCTCWLTVAVTVVRFLSVRFMTYGKLICSMARVKRAILAIFLASFLFHFSKFFEYVPNVDLKNPRPLIPTGLSKSKAYDTAMHITNITLAVLLPIIALIVLNSFLIYFLITHRRRMLQYKSTCGSPIAAVGDSEGGSDSSTSGGNNNSATMDVMHVSTVVVVLVLVFVTCHSLGVFMAFSIAVHGRFKIVKNPLFVTFNHINSLLVTVNSSVNFLVYCSINRKFRTMFTSIFIKPCLSLKNGEVPGFWSKPQTLGQPGQLLDQPAAAMNTN